MIYNLELPKMSEDEALSFLMTWLRKKPQCGTIVHINDVICNKMQEQMVGKHLETGDGQNFDWITNAEPFYVSAWQLCRRGILAQAPTLYEGGHLLDKKMREKTVERYGQQWFAGETFLITEFGESWLKNLGQEVIPAEFGRFSKLLGSHETNLGLGYAARSREALVCYRSQAYLACCAMCGAAAESIILALAIEKVGDEAEVLKQYAGATGRSKVEKLITSGRNGYVHEQLPHFTNLLTYWRNESAHGAQTSIGEEEAFTSLLLLLRFAQFATSRWTELTGR